MTTARDSTSPWWMILALWALAGHAPALLSLALTRGDFSWSMANPGSAMLTGEIVAGFAFTMMGFLVTALTLLAVFGESRAIRTYRARGNLRILIAHIGITMLELAATFVLALMSIARPPSALVTEILINLAVGGLGMTLVCVLPVLVLQVRAAGEKPTTLPRLAQR